MSNWFKRNATHLAIIGILIAICFFYFTPAFQGKTLGQTDVIGAQSTQTEINHYREKDTTILWTNQIFGGMPTFQIWAPYPDNVTTWVVKAVTNAFPDPLYNIFILLFGSYFLFCVLKLNPWLAAAGAVAFTFSSYNIILLAAGHSNQSFAISFFAPIIASIILTLRGRYWLGGSLTALFLALEIRANHVQMTYYLLLVIFILLGIELYHAIKNKTTNAFLKSLGYLGAGALLALMVNASSLWSTYEYGKETIRGQSNLKQTTAEPSNGLDKNYAYEYSQTPGETFTFLIPNAYGGDSGLNALDFQNSDFNKAFVSAGIPQEQVGNALQQLAAIGIQFSTYWGDKPLTSGPHYMGAVICFLFIFGLFIVRNRIKWWLLASVILTILLSFGASFPYVSDIFFKYFPLYNKFRAIESILSVTGLCVPILAILAIKEITDGTTDKADALKKLKITFYILGGLTLLMAVLPDLLLSFRPASQATLVKNLTQVLKNDSGSANSIVNALVRDRIYLERMDAIRSFVFVVLTFGALFAFIKGMIKPVVLCIIFFALILVDLWQIDKRYLKDEYFTERQENLQQRPREIDQLINRDTDPDYRVVDLGQSPKQDMTTPFFHKSLWGYSAARLKRIQEVIDNQFSKSINQDILDMMNTKYIITQDPQTGNQTVKTNNTACGHAWFVKDVEYVKDADEEMKAISAFSPKDKVIVDQRFKGQIDGKSIGMDPNGSIKLTSYSPDHMVYQSGTSVNSIAVFSEIYYDKGWTMYVDGKEQPYFRADYLLRAAVIPVGNHKVEFIFHPASYYTGEKISLAGSILLVLALGGVVFMSVRKKPGTEVKEA
ncbi:YfhO family protein [Mucilaginibacter ginsenosidivorans]|uniref:YfhO family protein n=1 Tax=Mucilaginibacter ginsenosidivorans TaxID=398053 RepID=A0A5B8UQH2_9SPHI|nr:YfhO family protein [Mucilaginibacter ginsenosidivorans]QEC61132.1 YfhO family protein [Mucilaginibacter ginsenosidivorans]